VLREGVFCVNLLQSSQAAISQAFGGKAKGTDRFLVGEWEEGDWGLPCLPDAQANLFCRVDGAIPYGTHKILIGRVESGRFTAEVMPLIYQDGGYAAASRLIAHTS
jgi:flavin reductase (DIM6/NTAB) family NADH-FMN oxidoreductase RutF